MTTRTLSPEEFEGAMVAIIPTHVMPRIREVYFDVLTQADEAIGAGTPVDTGYLRASKTATVGEEAPPSMPGPRDPRGSYAAEEADAQAAAAIVRGAAELAPVTIGFRAEYAPFVEDTHHMVKSARGRFAQFVDTAVKNAER